MKKTVASNAHSSLTTGSFPPDDSFLQVHRKQYVLGPTKMRKMQGWCHSLLGEEHYLCHCPELRISKVHDKTGNLWYLVGLALQTLPNAPDPLEQIENSHSEMLPQQYHGWAGRWVLIGSNQIHMDASGLLGCFYGKDHSGRMWISSSPALLAECLSKTKVIRPDERKLYYEYGISWYTPPLSKFEGIKRLLPSQCLHWRTGEIKFRELMPRITTSRTIASLIPEIIESVVTPLQRLQSMKSKLWLGLTGGYDSRTMLALARYADCDIIPYTRLAARMSLADRLLPPKLSAVAGYHHEFMQESRGQHHRQRLVELHTAGNVSKGDAMPVLRGTRDRMQGIAFGGLGFPFPRGFWRIKDLPPRIKEPDHIAYLICRLFRQKVDTSADQGLLEWLQWICQYPQENLDWRDRFLIEQRRAGWLSSKEQLYDMLPLERLSLHNSARTISLILSIPQTDLSEIKLQELIIQQTFPPLSEYPFNPPERSFGWHRLVRKRLSRPSVFAEEFTKKILRLQGTWSLLKNSRLHFADHWKKID